MPKNRKQYVAEISRCGRAERESRSLTMSERTRMEGLLEQAKAQRDLEKRSGRWTPARRCCSASAAARRPPGRTGRPFRRQKEYQQVRSGARGQTWSTGPIQVSDVAMDLKGTLLENGRRRPGRRARPAVLRSRASSTSCSSRSAWPTCSASRRDRLTGPLCRRGHRHERGGGCGRGRSKARVDARRDGDHGGDSEDRHGAADLATRCSRTRRRSRPT